MTAADRILPPLRGDLELFPQPDDDFGCAAAMIYDPLRHAYYRLAGDALAMTARWDCASLSSLRKRMRQECQRDVSDDEIMQLHSFLENNYLLATANDAGKTFNAIYRRVRSQSLWSLLIHSYVFFRIPLLRPARMLRRITPYFEFAFRTGFWWSLAGLALAGAYLVSREWDRFVATAAGQLSPAGLLMIALVLLLLKSVHELGHAITATRYGCRVSTMGVAFMVLAPMLYTDTTDAWRLADTKARMRITIAGVAAESIVAVLALLLWAFLPDGAARSFAFTLAVTAPATTLLVNLNPFMRFDGYFYLMDRWRIENLQPRSFALARWRLREHLFALGLAAPEAFALRTRRKLVAYAWCTWTYRLVLFIAIALLVYALFAKVVGVILFAVEIAYFILRPIWSELKIWWGRRRQIVSSRARRIQFRGFGSRHCCSGLCRGAARNTCPPCW